MTQTAEQAARQIEERLREEIAQAGDISFARFMELALYHPEYGYYRRAQKPIGREGDFFTASQVQPLFGRLIRQYCLRLRESHAPHLPLALMELGPGRGEMREAFPDFLYRSADAGDSVDVRGFHGFVFANELFDAIPVLPAVRRAGGFHELRVTWRDPAFAWIQAAAPHAAITAYAERFGAPAGDGFEIEAHFEGIALLRDLLEACGEALLIFIDYGYHARDWRRFPKGSLMSYRAHQASAEVLRDPGLRDITSHVPFHALARVAEECGCSVLRSESLGQALLFAGEQDQFASALASASSHSDMHLRQQLKLLLYGMGETFQVLALHRPPST